jgi:hypothetical protein
MYRYRILEQLLVDIPKTILNEHDQCVYEQSKTNHLELLYERFPHVNWNYHDLATNENCTLKMVLNTPNNPWDTKILVANRAMSFDDLCNLPNFERKWQYASSNPNITIEIFEAHPEYDWDLHRLASNPNFSIQYIKNIAARPDVIGYLEWKSIASKIDKFEQPFRFANTSKVIPENYYDDLHKAMKKSLPLQSLKWIGYLRFWLRKISSYIHVKYVNDCPDLEWNFRELSVNKTLDINTIRRFPHGDWDWVYISQNKAIKLTDISNNMGLPWNWNTVCINPNMTVEWFIDNVPNYQYLWHQLSRNRFIDFTKYPNYPWEVQLLCDNIYFDMNYISSANININASIYYVLQSNDGLLSDDILSIPNVQWHSEFVSNNSMNAHTKILIKKLRRYKIRLAFLRSCISDRSYFSYIPNDLISLIAAFMSYT